MGISVVTKALSKKYTDESISGTSGALAGKNCTIKSITKTGSKNTVTFQWTADDGSTKTNTMLVNDGKSPVSATIDANNHVIFTYDDGTKIDAGEMPATKVSVSKETGNALTEKTDGLYVTKGSVEISAKSGNIIKSESDGLYAKADEVKKSAKTGNTLTIETDGLYVPATDISGKVDKVTGKGLSTNDLTDTLKAQYDKAEENVQSDWNVTDTTSDAFIKNKPTVDSTYSATSDNAQSGKAVASGIATEIGKLTYLSKKIATKAEIDEYVADATKASFNVIYLLKDTSVSGKDKYFEYQRLGDDTSSTFEMTGDTSTDLSDYVKKEAGKGLSTNDYADTDKAKVDSVHCDIGSVRVGEIEDTSLGKHSHLMGFTSSSKTDPVIRYINYKEDGKSSKERLLLSYDSANEDLLVKGNANDKYTEFRLSNYAKTIDLDDKAGKSEVKAIYDNGFASRNLFDEQMEIGGIDTTSGSPVTYATRMRSVNYIEIDATKSYYICTKSTVATSATKLRIFYYDNSKTFISYQDWTNTLTIPSGAKYIRFITIDGYGTIYNNDIILNVSDSKNGTYSPYAKSNVELTKIVNDDLKMLGWSVPAECPIQNYTDSNGIFHQRVDRVDLGSLTWGWGTYVTDTWNYTLSSYKTNGTTYTIKYDKTVWSADIQPGQYMTTDNHIVINNGSDTTKPSGYLYYELATEVTKSVDGNEATREKTLQTIACSVEPTEKSTIYDFQDDRLKNANMVILCFSKLGNNGIVCYETNTWHSLTSYDPDDPYWSSTLMARFNRSEGKVYFRVVYKGGSQTFENCKLTSVCYYN